MTDLLSPRMLVSPLEIAASVHSLVRNWRSSQNWLGIPIYLTLYGGIQSVDRKLIAAGCTLDLSAIYIIRHVIIPGAMPSLLVGIRYGLSIAWLNLVVAEQINASSGIGYILTYARDFLQTDVIVVCLLVDALMGLLTDGLVRAIETYSLRWRPTMVS